ncbi:hypothetical protein AB0M45_09725 [Nocardia sp. NPDC051787]
MRNGVRVDADGWSVDLRMLIAGPVPVITSGNRSARHGRGS